MPNDLIPVRQSAAWLSATLLVVTSGDLKPEQARRLAEQCEAMQGYLVRLRTRMERLHFRHDDPLYLDVCRAFDAMMALRMSAHYLACGMPPMEKLPSPPTSGRER